MRLKCKSGIMITDVHWRVMKSSTVGVAQGMVRTVENWPSCSPALSSYCHVERRAHVDHILSCLKEVVNLDICVKFY